MKINAEVVYNQMLDKLITQDSIPLYSELRGVYTGFARSCDAKDYITRIDDSYSLMGMFISPEDTYDSGSGVYKIIPSKINSKIVNCPRCAEVEGFSHPTSKDRFVYVSEKSEALSRYGTWIQSCERDILYRLPNNFTNADVVDLCIDYSKRQSQFILNITSQYINDYLLLR